MAMSTLNNHIYINTDDNSYTVSHTNTLAKMCR